MTAEGLDEPADSIVYADEDADRLTELVLDVLGPALAFWRAEAARRLEVDAPSLLCLDLVRRHGRAAPVLIAERTGLTRSAVSKLVRRLARAGQVDLVGGGRGQALEVAARAHEGRDAERLRLFDEVRRRGRWSVVAGLDERERATAVRLLIGLAGCLQGAAAQSVDVAAEARRVARRRREPDVEWW